MNYTCFISTTKICPLASGTPGQTSNARPAEQAVLRRDCTAPSRLQIAMAVEAQGVHKPSDLKLVLPETWRLLEMRFARPSPS